MADMDKPDWAEALKERPFGEQHFTEALKTGIRKRIKRESRRKIRTLPWLLAAAAAGALIFLLFRMDGMLPLGGQAAERSVYNVNGETRFQVFPEPELRAGVQAGYIFRFAAPFSEFRGKKLSIAATHLRTGQQADAVRPVEIMEPSSGYEGLERFTARFALPLGGLWRYEVALDGERYGDVVLSLSEPSWDISPTFKSGSYSMRGIEGKVGFIDPGFVAGKANKYLWHFWGEDGELDGELTVMAVKKGDDRMIEVFSGSGLGGGVNGADRTLPSMMALPEAGVWRLLPFIDGLLFDSIVVEVKEDEERS
ncbi:DUF4871 domain-containing protein [Paenibacillus arenilitoris]|uniref:DUF4871 domain-containing protein n=1 Tax=Paenibacillus arenilitoris TaxID=2772299 RepID=A0A927H684_9BACL|nr:DUF4871 domain-containing protein [Paenibacillus arenilitoris]MBD2869237.1 DUF4871 domain-containing protein [Paenibacillus arenilitoris]